MQLSMSMQMNETCVYNSELFCASTWELLVNYNFTQPNFCICQLADCFHVPTHKILAVPRRSGLE